ncbi:hypothetical protein [Microbacterium caowuchunii]|uniref:Uncharacterized protein n=1 Tax=Microbacterium caowuchunii TaxID=2614638 RepID=A0A5N0TF99_9MICO|nr:hypothetical protein [Microbacterium caowuchunii]KAA9133732.1 hypothetical protein F6B40_08240 [Microbacterium caowuchunii]
MPDTKTTPKPRAAKPATPAGPATVEGPAPTTPLAILRAPFPAAYVSKLPKQVQRDDKDRGRCEPGTKYSADGVYCHGYHARSVHLDYVGHADVTARLLDADPHWNWEPVEWGEDGFPKRDRDGGMWIKLTVGGVTRLGYGDAQGKNGPNAVKEVIGDALRNAAMRFGVGLDLWSKAEAHDSTNTEDAPPARPAPAQAQQRPQGSQRPAAARTAPQRAQTAEDGTDWVALAEGAENIDALGAVWQRARAAKAPAGVLDAIAGIAYKRGAKPKGAPATEAPTAEPAPAAEEVPA